MSINDVERVRTFSLVIISILMGLIAAGVGLVISQNSTMFQRYDILDNRLTTMWSSFMERNSIQDKRIDVLEERQRYLMDEIPDIEKRVRILESNQHNFKN
jgi:hypothetical protein